MLQYVAHVCHVVNAVLAASVEPLYRVDVGREVAPLGSLALVGAHPERDPAAVSHREFVATLVLHLDGRFAAVVLESLYGLIKAGHAPLLHGLAAKLLEHSVAQLEAHVSVVVRLHGAQPFHKVGVVV